MFLNWSSVFCCLFLYITFTFPTYASMCWLLWDYVCLESRLGPRLYILGEHVILLWVELLTYYNSHCTLYHRSRKSTIRRTTTGTGTMATAGLEGAHTVKMYKLWLKLDLVLSENFLKLDLWFGVGTYLHNAVSQRCFVVGQGVTCFPIYQI